MRFLVTGGSGFIGSNFVIEGLRRGYEIYNIDKLTYAASLDNLKDIADSNYTFQNVDICNFDALKEIFLTNYFDGVFHLAAESHVDRSIENSDDFISTNIIGTHNILKCCHLIKQKKNKAIRLLHVSTDEVFGELGSEGKFTESTPYKPNSPYSASKASSDFLVRAWYETFGIDTVITNCSNNYGPYQFPEKLIPKTIISALQNKDIGVYGNGKNVRDWLHVHDHVNALFEVFFKSESGKTFNIGSSNEIKNIDIVRMICDELDMIIKPNVSFSKNIKFIEDRKGHDFRYAIDPSYISQEINWKPEVIFSEGLKSTVQWYVDNQSWWNK